MPHKKKKSFIESKKAVSFHLVHRSQRDPLAADETAPQRVLLPAEKVEVEKRQEEQKKFGVFFDDNYDYLQHLKEALGPSELVLSSMPLQRSRIVVTADGGIGEEIETIPAPAINLPSSVFASELEEEVGLLNKAAPVRGPQLDLDPDIIAALDEDFDFNDPDNILEDDFVLKANNLMGGQEEDDDINDGEGVEDSEGEDYDSEGPVSDEDDDKLPFGKKGGGVQEFSFMEEETKSRFTNYSLTSSVMRRNEQLTLLDERFEKFFEQFDEDEIGALDNVELEGFIQPDNCRLQEVVNEYYQQKAKDYQKPDNIGPRELSHIMEEDREDEETEEMETIVVKPKIEWDCESILSTYSNLHNHPTLILDPPKRKPIKISHKTGIPLDALPQKGPTTKQVEQMQMINDSDLPRVSTQPRPKDETKEEKKSRKQMIKEEKKVERRMEKKANKMAFKMEKKRQEKELQNLRQNIQGLKLL
ncbi:protein LTV1 homolog isoform X1 [Latimeria chalumnae]|uniref:protein LTV1 homolog isoform X1 n=1 Tax=Latimeria chalumnae TaxID=7897 RepID=UPI0003C1954F|nr:PREDICTED: protein LTV1 homolog isoform X1 [Latimeria chalumnae]|eukprot:XP_006010352.1 PREDICTED: protein LTV1 homolog isoform X1 [Latimeria chalumnae]